MNVTNRENSQRDARWRTGLRRHPKVVPHWQAFPPRLNPPQNLADPGGTAWQAGA